MKVDLDVLAEADSLAERFGHKSFFPVRTLTEKIRLRTAIHDAILAERQRCAELIERRKGVIPDRQEIAADIRSGVVIGADGRAAA